MHIERLILVQYLINNWTEITFRDIMVPSIDGGIAPRDENQVSSTLLPKNASIWKHWSVPARFKLRQLKGRVFCF